MMIPFLKMNGAGNDFVVLDARARALPPLDWRRLANRRTGIGCDQGVVLESSEIADATMRIFNADGGEVAACGNASRCAAFLVAEGRTSVTLETKAGVITARLDDPRGVTVDMNAPRLAWQDIPLAREVDTRHLPIALGPFSDPVAVSMGNPHMVFFVAPDAEPDALAQHGQALECHALFPERANVGEVQVESRSALRLRVFERGAGLTLACGTGACAALVAAHLRGLTEREADVHMPGGTLHVHWRADNDHVEMTGPVRLNFKGEFAVGEYAP